MGSGQVAGQLAEEPPTSGLTSLLGGEADGQREHDHSSAGTAIIGRMTAFDRRTAVRSLATIAASRRRSRGHRLDVGVGEIDGGGASAGPAAAVMRASTA